MPSNKIPDTSKSSKVKSISDSLVNDTFERIAAEASRSSHDIKRSTISTRTEEEANHSRTKMYLILTVVIETIRRHTQKW